MNDKLSEKEKSDLIPRVYAALENVIDPEIGIDVVNLGLVYSVYFDDEDWLKIDITLTTPACPLSDMLEEQIAEALDGLVPKFALNWVWTPAWNMNMISDFGREQLAALGFSSVIGNYANAASKEEDNGDKTSEENKKEDREQ